MKKPIIKCVYVHGRGVGLFTGTDAQIKRRLGTENVERIRPAKAKDIAYVKAMGGFVPDGRAA